MFICIYYLCYALISNIPHPFQCRHHGWGGTGWWVGTLHLIVVDPWHPFCLAVLAVDHQRQSSTSQNVVVVFHFAIVWSPTATIVGTQSQWYSANLPVQCHQGGKVGSHSPHFHCSCHRCCCWSSSLLSRGTVVVDACVVAILLLWRHRSWPQPPQLVSLLLSLCINLF